jgi:very-short-patch-repair endonuclease
MSYYDAPGLSLSRRIGYAAHYSRMHLKPQKERSNMHSQASAILDNHLIEQVAGWQEFLKQCESPVEEQFAAELIRFYGLDQHCIGNRLYSTFCSREEFMESMLDLFYIIVEAQHKVDEYKTDFLIYLTRDIGYWHKQPMWFKTIIEIDGHDFHERTKKQVSRDKQRERHLVKRGYRVLRFSGSDVYNDSFKCVEEIHEILYSDASRLFDASRNKLGSLLFGPDFYREPNTVKEGK